MRHRSKKFAIIGIIWAIILPALYFFPHVTGWPVMDLRMASYILRHSATTDADTNGVVSVSTNSLTSAVSIIKGLEAAESRHQMIFDVFFVLVTSVILVVLSVCVLKLSKPDDRNAV